MIRKGIFLCEHLSDFLSLKLISFDFIFLEHVELLAENFLSLLIVFIFYFLFTFLLFLFRVYFIFIILLSDEKLVNLEVSFVLFRYFFLLFDLKLGDILVDELTLDIVLSDFSFFLVDFFLNLQLLFVCQVLSEMEFGCFLLGIEVI